MKFTGIIGVERKKMEDMTLQKYQFILQIMLLSLDSIINVTLHVQIHIQVQVHML